VSGGDFISRSEGQLCARRGIEDRSQVVRDLRRVEKHLGAIAAADQLGLPPGGIESIANRKAAISSALLVAMYGASGARLLPTLAPREPIDAGVAKIMAAAGARAPLDKLGASGAVAVARAMAFDMAKSPKPPAGTPTMGPRDLDAHERQVLAEVGTNRAALVAILRRVRDVAGDWRAAGVELGLGKSTVMNLAGGHSKFSFRVAQLLLTWDRENPVSGADTVAAAPNNAGTVTGAADSPLAAPPPNILTPANDDPFAVALTALVKAKDETIAARAAVGAEIERLDAQLLPLQAQRAVLARRADMLVDRWTELHAALDRLQAVAK
jgi:hypothetical protein